MVSTGKFYIAVFISSLILIIAFLYISPLVENIQEVTPAMTDGSNIATQDINALSESFNTLRQTPGHFQGGTYDREVDGPKGKKFQVMKALAETLGVPGTPAADILQTMGKPDELTSKLDVVENVEIEMMPGPIIGSDDDSALASTSEQGSYYLVYYWRGSHDYLYFKVDTVSEKVTASGWYNALD